MSEEPSVNEPPNGNSEELSPDEFVEIRPLDASTIATSIVDLAVGLRNMNLRIGLVAALSSMDHDAARKSAADALVDQCLADDERLLIKVKLLFEKLELPWPE